MRNLLLFSGFLAAVASSSTNSAPYTKFDTSAPSSTSSAPLGARSVFTWPAPVFATTGYITECRLGDMKGFCANSTLTLPSSVDAHGYAKPEWTLCLTLILAQTDTRQDGSVDVSPGIMCKMYYTDMCDEGQPWAMVSHGDWKAFHSYQNKAQWWQKWGFPKSVKGYNAVTPIGYRCKAATFS